ncbi:MAG: phytoene desaturase [Flavobacteriales bacterium]|nr:phytoene desaturase [Flavobacteriales bacterium]
MKKLNAIVIGSGVGGLATAIRLAKLGIQVTIFEANAFPGGKVNSKQFGAYRFDMGPSVFTEPHLIEELISLSGSKDATFQFHQLEESCRYFFSDGQELTVFPGVEKVADTFSKSLGENKSVVAEFLERQRKNYEAVYPVFIAVSLHRFKHWFNRHVPNALLRLTKYGLLSSMHKVNSKTFSNPKTAQIFDRLATYNGSSPYKTPGMLNIISHLELNVGPAMPKGGMVAISNTLYKLCLDLGVNFHFNEKVTAISHSNNKITGVQTSLGKYDSDIVVSNMDVHFTYEKLLSNFAAPSLNLKQEKSSSAIVFYWGIKKQFPKLGVHNIFFAENYKAEFKAIFETKEIYTDPTIYIHISSKVEQVDAPSTGENWFVMINAPINVGQDWDKEIQKLRSHILNKLSQALGEQIEPLIEVEEINEPRKIEAVYNGKQGSIYGNSSNSSFAAFYRHPNFSKKLKGLYFSGVTVHPGGGIPLALNSAKIVERCVIEDFR